MSMRDSAATIDIAIRSILLQTLTNWELVLIDDGSRDNSAALAAAFRDPRIRLIRHTRSLGLEYRLNEAIPLARGEFIARMDADDVCYPERLAVQVATLRSDPTIDLLSSHALIFRRQGEVLGFIPTLPTHEKIAADPLQGFSFLHPTWCARAAWFRNHPYDNWIGWAGDQDLLLRTQQFSRFAAVDKILLGYRREYISPSKRWRGHFSYSRAIWRYAKQSGERRRAAKKIYGFFRIFALDMVRIAFGAGDRLLKQRTPPLTNPEELDRWRTVWAAVSTPHSEPAPLVAEPVTEMIDVSRV